MSNEPSVEYQLGALGVNWDRVVAMKSDLFDRAALMHQMGAVTKADIVSDKAEKTGQRLCYDGGIDGDGRYWIEPIPSHHVDWDMNEEEWHELRSLLWWSGGKYTEKLKAAGKLGLHTPPLPPPARHDTTAASWVSAFMADGRTPITDATGRNPQPPPSPQPFPAAGKHDKQYPVDTQEDTWRCGCGMIYKVTSGFAICPNDPDPPTGTWFVVGDPPVIT